MGTMTVRVRALQRSGRLCSGWPLARSLSDLDVSVFDSLGGLDPHITFFDDGEPSRCMRAISPTSSSDFRARRRDRTSVECKLSLLQG